MPAIRLAPVVPSSDLPVIDLELGQSKTIGRGRHSDVVVNHATLSRVHARITLDAAGQIAIDDLGSRNGIFVNGSEQDSAYVMLGDVIRFGGVEYVVNGGDEPRTSQSAPIVSQTILRRLGVNSARKVDRLALEALLATSREMMAFEDLPALLERVLDRLSSIVKSDRAAILLIDHASGAILPRAVRPPGAYSSISEFASSTAVNEALTSREAIIVHDIHRDPKLQHAHSVLAAGVRSVICVPLLGRAGPIGALYADKLGIEQFEPELAEYAAAFAGHAAAALETAQLYDERERHFRATLEAFAKAIDARDRYTAGHSERVTAYTLVLARVSGQFAGEFEIIRRAGMLHDIGKVGVPDAVLHKPGPLDKWERELIEAHVTIGYRMLDSIPFLKASLPAVRGHHERWDGRGYPDKLRGEHIPAHARLMAVADSYDAMTSVRPYREALPAEEAARRLRADGGAQFDPDVVALFDQVEEEFATLHQEPDAADQRAALLRPAG
jgi:putative nucleotidyltransferase with HDIG domain